MGSLPLILVTTMIILLVAASTILELTRMRRYQDIVERVDDMDRRVGSMEKNKREDAECES